MLDLQKELSETRAAVDRLNTLLLGNGDPMGGFVVRVSLLERWRTAADRRALGHTAASVVAFAFIIGIIVWFFVRGT